MRESVNNLHDKRNNRVFTNINNVLPVVSMPLSTNSPAALLERPNQGSGDFDTYFLDDDYRQDNIPRPSARQNAGSTAPKLRMQL